MGPVCALQTWVPIGPDERLKACSCISRHSCLALSSMLPTAWLTSAVRLQMHWDYNTSIENVIVQSQSCEALRSLCLQHGQVIEVPAFSEITGRTHSQMLQRLAPHNVQPQTTTTAISRQQRLIIRVLLSYLRFATAACDDPLSGSVVKLPRGPMASPDREFYRTPWWHHVIGLLRLIPLYH